MTSPYQLSVWAERILDSLDETGIANSLVVTWFQNNLYKLNLALGTGFVTNSSGYIEPDMNQFESGIYEQQYFCYYYKKKANANLGASSWDWTEIRGEDQGTIRKVSKNETAKTYLQLSKECEQSLKDLIEWYAEQDMVMVGQILLGDRGDIASGDLMYNYQPPNQYFDYHSTIWQA
jgi:hypothetical protein